MTGWNCRYSPGDAGWLEALEEAVAADNPHRTGARLAELVLRFDQVGFPEETAPPAPDLPQGRPARQLRRQYARTLLAVAEAGPHQDSGVWRALGLLHRTALPEPSPDAPPGRDPEVLQRLQDTQDAMRQARATGNPLMAAIALLHRSWAERDTLDVGTALASAEAAQDLLTAARLPQRAAEELTAALGAPSWLDSEELLVRLRCVAHLRAGMIAVLDRDYDRAERERQSAGEAALQLLTDCPSLYGKCLFEQYEVARHRGDVDEMRTRASRCLAFADRYPDDPRVLRAVLRAPHQHARAVGDWDGALEARLARASSWVRSFGAAPDTADTLTPEAALAAVEEFKRRSLAPALSGIGNDAFEVAQCLIESGRASSDAAAADEARSWLAVAAAAWEGRGLNGLTAVAFRGLELDAIQGRRPSEQIGREMVAASRRWRRSTGQRTAAVGAARYGSAGDPVVLERLQELLAGAPPVDAALLHLAIGRWHLVRGDDLAGSDTEGAARAWEEAVAAAEAAELGLTALRPSGRELLLHPERQLEALQVQAGALQRLRASGRRGRHEPRQELDARVRSLPAVAQLMVAGVAPQHRAAEARRNEHWLAGTVELAAQLQDPAAADAAMEVVRRDKVGAILAAMHTDPAVPQRISDLAIRLASALSISLAATSGSDEDPTSRDAVSGTRAAVLGEQVDEALDIIGRLIGPLARDLFDPMSVQQPHTGVLTALHPTGSAAVLSLWLLDGSDQPRLVRRLTQRRSSEGPVEEHLDIVDVPPWLPGLCVDDGADLFFARLQQLGEVLLPGDLRDLLATADTEHPVALTVIPTRLLGIPFAALPVDDRHLLLDLAVITVAQSLRTALVLAAVSGGRQGPLYGALGVYDLHGLRHAATEWADLERHYPPGRHLRTLQELQDALGAPDAAAILALSLHGLPGVDGWAQAKRLPDGSALTPGHVLRWQVPPIVVGASCFTDIRADADGELGGFPIAFQLRGAATVIGTLHEVHDRSTAEIMGLFYAATAAGFDPAAALRLAQRIWIAKDRPERLPAAEHWALLIAYGVR
jgi:hypothetical protein